MWPSRRERAASRFVWPDGGIHPKRPMKEFPKGNIRRPMLIPGRFPFERILRCWSIRHIGVCFQAAVVAIMPPTPLSVVDVQQQSGLSFEWAFAEQRERYDREDRTPSAAWN